MNTYNSNKEVNTSNMTPEQIKERQAKILLDRGFTQQEVNALIY